MLYDIFEVIGQSIQNFSDSVVRDLNYIGTSFYSSDRLDKRMKRIVDNINDRKYYGDKPVVICLSSKELLNYINHVELFQEKLNTLEITTDVLFEVSKLIYEKFNPNLIYSFENEINIVFYDNECGIYGNNINKTITMLSSFASVNVSNMLRSIGFSLDVYFTSKIIEFDIDHEVLNYLIWRQMDCRRNTITLLYKCLNSELIIDNIMHIENIKISDMIKEFKEKDIDIDYKLLVGNVIKKHKLKLDNCERTFIKLEHFKFSDNFEKHYKEYIVNKVLVKE